MLLASRCSLETFESQTSLIWSCRRLGMNPAVRAIVRMGIYLGCKVYFIHEVLTRHQSRSMLNARFLFP